MKKDNTFSFGIALTESASSLTQGSSYFVDTEGNANWRNRHN